MVGGAYERSAAGRLGSGFYATRINPGHRKRGHIRRLGALGYKVTLEPAACAPHRAPARLR